MYHPLLDSYLLQMFVSGEQGHYSEVHSLKTCTCRLHELRSRICYVHAGMKLIQRHRKINEVLKEEIAQIHALQIVKCQAPEQPAE
jgi:ABC-type phosphate/phosphonate transport system ATPase subunit